MNLGGTCMYVYCSFESFNILFFFFLYSYITDERTAPMFARESARWSLNNENIIAYNQSYRMSGLVGISLKEALLQLPEEERSYTGSGASTLIWPYTPLNGSRLAFN